MYFTEEKELEKMRAELLAPRIRFCKRFERIRDNWEDPCYIELWDEWDEEGPGFFEYSDYYDFNIVTYSESLKEIKRIEQMDSYQIREFYRYEFDKEHPVHPFAEEMIETLSEMIKSINDMSYSEIEEAYRILLTPYDA